MIKFNKLKVVIVHDVLFEYGGAEKVLECMFEVFPHADLYTLYFNKKNQQISEKFADKKPRSSFLQYFLWLNYLGRFFSITKFISWLYFYQLDLKDYDLVISSSHSFNSKIVRKNKKALHLCYLHAPPKYLFNEFNELNFIKKFPFNILFFLFLAIMRWIDIKAATHPDLMLVNSKTVQKRAKKYYQRNSLVLHPPVINLNQDFKKNYSLNQNSKKNKKKYFVAHSRLVKQKGIELIIKTCNKYKLPLVVIGTGYYKSKLEQLAGSTIIFKGWVSDAQLIKIYSNAKALLYAAINEDFGIVPIEAMNFGVPVIAYASGGVKETVINSKTGVFFKDYSVQSLWQAIAKLEKISIQKKDCLKQAQKFNTNIFKKKLKKIIVTNYSKNAGK